MVQTDVLIVGGGPVGLTLALMLDRFDVSYVLLERDATTTDHPKSRGCTARTMELFRMLRVEHAIRSRGLADEADVTARCESLSGRVLHITHPQKSIHTPAPKCMVAQDVVEAALAAAAREGKGSDIRFETELESFEQHDSDILAQVRHSSTGERYPIRARYIVGCDGAGSKTRRLADIAMVGPETIAEFISYYFRADLSHLPHGRLISGFTIHGAPGTPGAIVITANGTDRWMTFHMRHSGTTRGGIALSQMIGVDPDVVWSESQLQEIIRAHAGVPDLKVSLINHSLWNMSQQVAATFRKSRTFLAGDAAHRFPPFGGMGLNSGIADAHNLAWKLAFALRGWGSDALLDTYTSERKPVAQDNTTWSMSNFARFERIEAAYASNDVTRLREVLIDFDKHMQSEGQALGYVYEEGALVPDGSEPLPPDPQNYWPSTRPGSRFPHMWLDPGYERSTLDWFTDSFVLVCGPDADEWHAAARQAARATGLPIQARRLPFLWGTFGFDREGAALVRPDGHVAWCPREKPQDLANVLIDVVRRVLAGGTLDQQRRAA